MDNNSGVLKLVHILEPLVSDLEEKKNCLKERKEELENVSRLLAYTKDNVEMLGIYADQDLVLDGVSKIGCDIEKYKASCYLLKSEDVGVKNLPQYEEAHSLIEDVIEFFKLRKAELTVEIQELKDTCDKKELEKKYFDILSNTNPLVDNVDEFKTVLNGYGLNDEDKIDILVSVINSNIANYEKENK